MKPKMAGSRETEIKVFLKNIIFPSKFKKIYKKQNLHTCMAITSS